MKKIYKEDLDQERAIQVALEALYDAAEADVATGGPDLIRGIFPTMKVINAQGITDIPDEKIKALLERMMQRQGGG